MAKAKSSRAETPPLGAGVSPAQPSIAVLSDYKTVELDTADGSGKIRFRWGMYEMCQFATALGIKTHQLTKLQERFEQGLAADLPEIIRCGMLRHQPHATIFDASDLVDTVGLGVVMEALNKAREISAGEHVGEAAHPNDQAPEGPTSG